jgi:hypothetical protein
VNSNNNESITKNLKDLKCCLRTKIGFRRQIGYHPELICLLMSSQQRTPIVNCVLVYSKNNMLLFGTDESVVCVDYGNRSILMNISCCDFYGFKFFSLLFLIIIKLNNKLKKELKIHFQGDKNPLKNQTNKLMKRMK